MRIDRHPLLDALCGEYLLGTLRGAARRRFERALQQEPQVASRLAYWQGIFVPRYAQMTEIQPSPDGWRRLERELRLERYRAPWHRRAAFWRGWAAVASVILVIMVALQTLPPASRTSDPVPLAELSGKADVARVTALLSPDGRTLELRAARAVVAGPTQSYELWLLPAEGTPPISLAVLGSLDARFALPPAQVGKLSSGAKLAVSVEPAGGSSTGQPTGPVILIGAIGT